MANRYTIQVKNQSGVNQAYALFNQIPRVTGRVQDQIWSNVFATGRAPPSATTSFEVYKQYYAVVGTSTGMPQDGVEVDVSGSKEVTLGSLEPTGVAVPGTTLELIIEDNGPQFGNSPENDEASPRAFEIQTSNDFDASKATSEGSYVIGLGGTRSGNGLDGPLATFVPEPGVRYTEGSMIDVNRVGRVITVDFSTLPSNSVVIVHDDRGRLLIQRE
ncbi:hypothetical protein FSARC_14510 [Fusarium sarcochroum]|uniref:Uncharacterized protein n=1 Tax=Fusarium sarcochroum TaxID=1208366 RepID=A0A8H4ST68_9HYPO|nr:hypothetical protein FSARC_14510 [Fusarium sarcochroum]